MGALRRVAQEAVRGAWRMLQSPIRKSASLIWRNPREMPNWFQLGYDKPSRKAAMASSAVYSCVSILAQEVSRLDIQHWDLNPDKSRSLQTQTAAARVMRKPNSYQSRSDFLLYMMQGLLLDGNAYAVASRDSRGAISALHPQDPSATQIVRVDESYQTFYFVGSDNRYGTFNPESGTYIPERDMLHLRLFTGTDPFLGVTPLQALGSSVALGANIQQQSAAFFENMSRPAGILRTPKPLSPEAADRLQKQWQDGMSGKFVGRTAVLDNDVDWRPLSMSAVDAEVIAQYRMSVENIAQVYRIPMFMLGDLSKTTFNSVETLQKVFIMSSLGFYLKHWENALDDFFGLDGNTYLEFDLERGLLRPDFEARMNGYVKGVQGGVLTPNEPRSRENLPPLDGGDRAYMQRQNWPLEDLGKDADNSSGDEDATTGSSGDDEATDDEVRAILRRHAA